jgi:GWxTD domain-containing protein
MRLPKSSYFSMLLFSTLSFASAAIAQDRETGSRIESNYAAHGKAEPIPPHFCFTVGNPDHDIQLEKDAFQKLPPISQSWLTEDVLDLITPDEKCTFLHLQAENELYQFIEQFWLRRSFDLSTPDNSFKTEYYERAVAANERYGQQTPWWQSDRGRIYVIYGRPDSIESHLSGETAGRPAKDGSETYEVSWERWHYRYLEGFGPDTNIEFVDTSGSGEYHLAMPEEQRNALFLAAKAPFSPYSHSRTGLPYGSLVTTNVQFKDLEALAVVGIERTEVRIEQRLEFARATHATTVMQASISANFNAPDLSRESSTGGDGSMTFRIFYRVCSAGGRVIETIEERTSRELNSSDFNVELSLALAPGPYKAVVVIQNVNDGEVGKDEREFVVPGYEELPASIRRPD